MKQNRLLGDERPWTHLTRLNAIGALKHYSELVNAEQLKASCRRNDKLVFACKSLVDHK